MILENLFLNFTSQANTSSHVKKIETSNLIFMIFKCFLSNNNLFSVFHHQAHVNREENYLTLTHHRSNMREDQHILSETARVS